MIYHALDLYIRDVKQVTCCAKKWLSLSYPVPMSCAFQEVSLRAMRSYIKTVLIESVVTEDLRSKSGMKA